MPALCSHGDSCQCELPCSPAPFLGNLSLTGPVTSLSAALLGDRLRPTSDPGRVSSGSSEGHVPTGALSGDHPTHCLLVRISPGNGTGLRFQVFRLKSWVKSHGARSVERGCSLSPPASSPGKWQEASLSRRKGQSRRTEPGCLQRGFGEAEGHRGPPRATEGGSVRCCL